MLQNAKESNFFRFIHAIHEGWIMFEGDCVKKGSLHSLYDLILRVLCTQKAKTRFENKWYIINKHVPKPLFSKSFEESY